MHPRTKKVLTLLRKRKKSGVNGSMFARGFNYNTALSELRASGYNIVGKRISRDNPLFNHWLISEPA